ncbi:MAG TPA: alpha/beta hydrolase [Rhizomicrobium sp.]
MQLNPARVLSHLIATGGSALLRAAIPLFNRSLPRGGYTVKTDIAYGVDPRHKLDLYVPDGLTRPAPALLFFYGGSWQSGSKAIYRAFGQAFAACGIVVAVADYRLYPQAKYPAFVADGAQALRFVHGHVGEVGGDAARIFLCGHSAGAYIAAMLAVKDSYLLDAHADPAWIRGVIGIAGPYDFLPLHDPALIDIFGGAREMATQPIKYAGRKTVPMLLAHGTADRTVGAGNSRRMAERLRQAGNTVELIEYAGVSHLGIVISLAHGFRGRTTLHEDMIHFITAH